MQGITRSSLLLFGGFTVASLLLTVFMFTEIADTSLTDRVEHTASFGEVNGLQAGEDVRVAGVRVGNVRAVGVEAGRAVVTFDVPPDLDLPVDTVARVRWVDVIGANEIVLEPGGSDQLLEPGAELEQTADATDLATAASTLSPLTETLDPTRVNTLVQAVLAVLDGRDEDVGRLLRDLDAALGTFTEREDTIDSLLDDYATVGEAIASREAQIQQLVDHLTTLVTTLDQSDAVLADALDDGGRFTALLDDFLGDAAGDLGEVLEDLQLVTGTVHDELDTVESVIDVLPTAMRDVLVATERGDAVTLHACVRSDAPRCADQSGAAAGASVLDLDGASLRGVMLGGAR